MVIAKKGLFIIIYLFKSFVKILRLCNMTLHLIIVIWNYFYLKFHDTYICK